MPGSSPDALIDRRRLKRRLGIWRVVAVLAVLAAALLAVDSEGDLFGRPYVARVWVTGFISDDSARDEAIRKLAEDDEVRAVVVRIDSPGGAVGGGEGLYRALSALAEKKPTVAVIDSLGTSAAYMAALAGERIFVRDSSVTGSIGVIMQSADITGLLERIGVKPETIKSAPLKGTPSPLEPLTPAAREAAAAVVRDLYDQFVDLVALRRKFDRPRAVELADGRIYTGRQARELGLVDESGGEPAARAWLEASKDVPGKLRAIDVRPGESTSWTGSALGLIGKTLFAERLRVDGPISVWHPGSGAGD
ncbi:signal peptide peptidase A [Stella humosa]|uniref:Signal peptide peptidase A n=1 Tax=Stella humosa TaxID=94 RepID=A0A3N1LIJ8_9PROT|nr:signal peptide peptidase SppA [Stella humosa]ROP90669.1 signal peptide peptidase A [Stella humosa]BBK29432.1 Clp protease [Stella humosa]